MQNSIASALLSLLLLSVTSHAQIVGEANKERDQRVTKWLDEQDANDDGRISPDEAKKQMKRNFGRLDVDHDGYISKSELAALATRQMDAARRWAERQKLPEGVNATRDLEYARVGEKSLKLDLYTPENRTSPRPLVVWIHGGAWRAGDKRNCPAIRLVEKGFVAASINYRLSQEAIFPAQIQDCKAAIRWFRANADEYGIDPDRIGVWGSSAGGHLVALLGTSGDVDELSDKRLGNPQQSSRVQAVCDFFGPTDLLQMDAHALPSAPFKHDAPDSPESRLIGASIQEHPEKAAKVNPISYVSDDDPPFLIVHGDKDPLVPHHQSQLLAEALTKVGVSNTFHTAEGYGHGFRGDKEIEKMVDEFFSRVLQPPAK